MPAAQRMGSLARRLAGDPLAFTGARGDAAIKRGRQFQRHQRAAKRHPGGEPGADLLRLGRQQAYLHHNPGRPQPRDAGAIDARIAIASRNHHPGNAGRDQRVRAGRGLAMMAAGLQRDIGGGTTRGVTGHRQRLRFGVRAAAGGRHRAADNTTLPDDDAADRRIGPTAAQSAPRQGQGRAHMFNIAHVMPTWVRQVRQGRPRNREPRGNCGRPRQNAHKRRRPPLSASPSPARRCPWNSHRPRRRLRACERCR